MDPKAIADTLMQTWPVRLAQSALSAAKLPGDVYSGDAAVPQSSNMGQENTANIGRATDLAGVVMGGSYAAPAMKDASGMGIRAYHGSPHNFDKFDMSKLGTGEGGQAFGRGLYFAENPKVAQGYRDQLTQGPNSRSINWFPPDSAKVWERNPNYNPGRMYEVDINAHPEQFLNYDKRIGEQTPEVLDAMTKFWGSKPNPYDRVNAYAIEHPGTVQEMRDAGIPGIKYLDQGSRAAGEGSSNYVVFDDKLINILKKYGIAGLGVPGLAAGVPVSSSQEQ